MSHSILSRFGSFFVFRAYAGARNAAIGKVAQAEKRGSLIRPKACSNCGTAAKLHAHHPDYTKPLDVMWLCHSCHGHIHLETHKRHGFRWIPRTPESLAAAAEARADLKEDR